MKLFTSILSLALVAEVIAAPGPPKVGPVKGGLLLPPSVKGPAPQYSIGKNPGPFAKVDGRLFVLNGKKQYFSGTNAWWMAHLSKNSDIDIAFGQVAKTGYKILRVWGFGDVNTPPPATNEDPNKVYFQLLNSTGSYINYGPDGIDRLDYVVHKAEKLNVALVLPFINNWGDYGGLSNVYSKAFGNNATNFYTHPQAQKAYRDWIKFVVNRYKKSSAIFAWELGNEPRCGGCPTSVVTKWAKEISEFIKSLDSKHLVTLGDEGWFTPKNSPSTGDGSLAYSGKDGVDFVENLKIKTLDYGTFHQWPHAWSYNYTWGSTWINQHDEIGRKTGKAIVCEEYGAPLIGNHTVIIKPWQDTLYKTGLASEMYWQFGTYDTSVPWRNLPDENAIFYNETEYKLLGFAQAKRMAEKKVPRN